jgi:tetratricopeptide (TPR) repeat protein
VFYHGGSLPGASALILRVPEKDQCVVLFHNAGMGHEEFLYEIATEVLNILYGKEFHCPKMSILYSVGITALFDSIEEVRKHYYYLKNNLGDAYIFNPDQLNTIAMLLLQFGTLENITGVLKMNIEEYPDQPSAYFELGKFYCDVEKKYNLAEEYLKKALELSEGESEKEIMKKIGQVEAQKNNETRIQGK